MIQCGNCGKKGHIFKNCHKPITSLGVICLKYDGTRLQEVFQQNKDRNMTYNQSKFKNLDFDPELDKKIKTNLKFLLVCRKHTLGFLELVRGNYELETIDDINHLIGVFERMTYKEIESIKTQEFDTLWNQIWHLKQFNNNHKKEYEISSQKYQKLKTGIEYENHQYDLNYVLAQMKSNYREPEWEFPKGRRKIKEDDITCAVREFKEETDFADVDFEILNANTISEIFMGSNHFNYKYIYYLAQSNKAVAISETNFHQQIEISNINWFSYDEATKTIRNYSLERLDVLRKVFQYVYYNLYVFFHTQHNIKNNTSNN